VNKSPYIASVSEPVVYVRIKCRELYGSNPRTSGAFQTQFAERFKYTHDNKQIAGVMTPSFCDCNNTTLCVVPAKRLEEFQQWLAEASWMQ
jgi:hypothetical protein